ncbi:MAG TPA: O-methyltransferase, partial [Membranihabitans sp.]|nr:O-methyltransferase [Membranihabitans sp.]
GMISGPYQGTLLRMLSQIIRPDRILEVGTFTAYSAVCLAEGLTDDGRLITIEKNESLKPLIEEHLSWSEFGHKVDVRFGDARDVLKAMEDTFDLVFIDAAKKQYGEYYEESLKRLRSGGVIVVDNVLWRGKVAEDNPDERTRSIQQFNEKISSDNRVEPFLMPIRDGLYVVRKK